MTNQPCRTLVLANNSWAHVEECIDCGCVTVHLGPISVRLEGVGLASLATLLVEANRTSSLRRELRSAPGGRGAA